MRWICGGISGNTSRMKHKPHNTFDDNFVEPMVGGLSVIQVLDAIVHN